MDKKVKKYIYVLNDITNLLLGKERKQAEVDIVRLRKYLIIVTVVLGLSIIFNIILLLIFISTSIFTFNWFWNQH